jgi:gas vesicle protein
MKYRKLVGEFLSQRSNHSNAQVAIALVAGLTAGAVLSILFAPSKGSTTRNGIASKVRNLLTGIHEEETAVVPEVPHFTHTVAKKRKSDIKTLVSEVHHNGKHTDQPIHE